MLDYHRAYPEEEFIKVRDNPITVGAYNTET